jgi:hypothetical protein
MADPHVITALHDKYSRTKGRLRHYESQCADLRSDLVHLEATIQMFRAEWTGGNSNPVAPYKPSRWLKRGQGIQTALTVLRGATAPMTAREITLAVLETLGHPMPPESELRRISSGFNQNLASRIGKGVERHNGKPWRWSLTPPVASSQPTDD